MPPNSKSLVYSEYIIIKIYEPAVSVPSSPVVFFINSFPGLLNPFPLTVAVSSLSLSEESTESICWERNKQY